MEFQDDIDERCESLVLVATMARSTSNARTFKYGVVELVLAHVFQVSMELLPAFRARIRHLRNLNVPSIRQPGSGQPISYTRADVIQLMIALEFELLGLSPAVAASFSAEAMKEWVPGFELERQNGIDLFLNITPDFSAKRRKEVIGISKAKPKNTNGRGAFVNISASLARLDQALDRS